MKPFCYYMIMLALFQGCSKQISNTPVTAKAGPVGKTYTCLALGDSYTIGESVEQEGPFPYQLASLLNGAGLPISGIKIIARTGWTTDELQAAIRREALTKKFDFVTLLIGVNNQYRHYSPEVYRKEFIELLNTAIAFANSDRSKVFVLSIPDWGATPFASGQDRAKIAAEIDLYNSINKEETLKAAASYTDITPGSRKAATDLSLVAADGLHPSAKMYALWTGQLQGKVAAIIK